MNKALVAIGSTISIGFGIWHLFVPKIWDWYSYIDPSATELVLAVRAINIFFSLSLILFGLINIFLAFLPNVTGVAAAVVLSATAILWLTRVVVQLLHPQGSIHFILQYGMLSVFVFVFCCYAVPLFSLLRAANQ